MKFRAGDLEFNATVADSSAARSPQTGNLLKSMSIQFRAQHAASHARLVEQAERRRTGGLFSLDAAGEPELEWRVRESAFTYVGNEPWGVNHHAWRIDQVERIACTRLTIGGIAFEPYEYVEASDADQRLCLAARARASEADLEALAQLAGAVEVVRLGVSDAPRSMRISYVWGAGRDGLSVAVRAEDAAEPRVTLGSRPSAEDALEDLVAVLAASGALSAAARADFIRRRHAGRRVTDVDAWPFSQEEC